MYKVLVIAYYFPPMGLSGVQRTLKFVKYMRDYNWEPVVLTSASAGYYAHDNYLLKEAESLNINIIRAGGKDINSRLARKGTIKMPPEFIRKNLSRISNTFFIPDNKKGWTKNSILTALEILSTEYIYLIILTVLTFYTIIL